MKRQLKTGAVYVHPFDDYDIMAGQGTIAMEMLREEDRIDKFIVPIGGGGLISGIAVAAQYVDRNIRIIGGQARNSCALYREHLHKETIGKQNPTTARGGQGTIAMEMLRQEDRIDTFIVPIGGGGLISGIAVAAKYVNRNIRIIGVQARNSCAMYRDYHHKKTIGKQSPTIAEGIDVKNPGQFTLPIIRDYVDDIITVSDAEIAAAVLYMLERNKALVEGSGAAALAALFKHNQNIKSRHCAIVVSGGNMDISTIPKIQRLADNEHITA